MSQDRSQVIDISDSPYPLNDPLTALYVDTPTQRSQSDKNKEMRTPPKGNNNTNSNASPYSPSRRTIPPLPVPENMEVQLKPTIPNSKRKFDINKLVFSGDGNNAALDELKSMLENIQNALVNIVERSKGNGSHIQYFGGQLKEFNETFKQRQENENDLLTTSNYKLLHKELIDMIENLVSHLQIGESDELKESVEQLHGKLQSIGDVIDSKFNELKSQLIDKDDLNNILTAIEHSNQDKSNQLDISHTEKLITEPLMSYLQSINIELQKLVTNETLIQQTLKITENIESYTNQQRELSSIDYQKQIEYLQAQLLARDVQILELTAQHNTDTMSVLEEKFHDLKIQELNDKLKAYELKDEIHSDTMNLFQENIKLKSENVKLETEFDLKIKLLTQLSSTYDTKLDKFITLSQRFEKLKLQTDSYISLRPDKQFFNNVKFDMQYDPLTSSLSSASSSIDTTLIKQAKRNVTLNESMLPSSNKLQQLELNNYYPDELREKRKLRVQPQSDPLDESMSLGNPQKKKTLNGKENFL